MSGKIIVISGSDGSGKATQAKILVERLRREGYSTETLDFPQYDDNFFGKFVGECLRGDYGDFIALHPKIASVMYAADRFESRSEIESWLAAGKVVVLDRYVSANQLHQLGKLSADEERKAFLEWLDHMEYGVFGLPRPTATIFLDVPVGISQKLLTTQENLKTKKYSNGASDLAEANREHLESAYQAAQYMLDHYDDWVRIECTRDGELLSREEIHRRIWTRVQSVI